ncbi:unnamed protein product, partial [marine sediment metagenome]
SNNNYAAVPNCIGWKTLSKSNGGGIAAFGAAGIGYGSTGTHQTERVFGWMEVHVFEELYNNKILGQVWANCITDYYNTFELELVKTDYKTMLEFSMFGDPTLVIEDGEDPVSIPADISSFLLLFMESIIDCFPLLGQIFAIRQDKVQGRISV